MKKSVLEKKQIPECAVELAGRLVKRVAWPERRQAMAEVTLALLDGKARTAEAVFGWGRSAVELGLQELRTGIVCINLKKARTWPQNAVFRGNARISVRRLGQNRFHNGLGELEFHFLAGRICRKSGLSRLFGRQSPCSTITLGANSKRLG